MMPAARVSGGYGSDSADVAAAPELPRISSTRANEERLSKQGFTEPRRRRRTQLMINSYILIVTITQLTLVHAVSKCLDLLRQVRTEQQVTVGWLLLTPPQLRNTEILAPLL